MGTTIVPDTDMSRGCVYRRELAVKGNGHNSTEDGEGCGGDGRTDTTSGNEVSRSDDVQGEGLPSCVDAARLAASSHLASTAFWWQLDDSEDQRVN